MVEHPSIVRSQLCDPAHEDGLFALCRDDNTYVCEQCFERYHRGHVVDYLKFVARDHLNDLRSLEARIVSSLSICHDSLRSFNKPLMMHSIADRVTEYYEALIAGLRQSCARKIDELQSAVGPQLVAVEKADRVLEQSKDELAGIISTVRQRQKACENWLAQNRFRRVHAATLTLLDLQQRVQEAANFIDSAALALRRNFAQVEFAMPPKELVARVEDTISLSPVLVAAATRNVATLPNESDTIKLFKALNEPKKAPAEERRRRSMTPECSGRTPTRREPRRDQVRTSVSSRKDGAMTKKGGLRIFYIDPVEKRLRLFYPEEKRKDSVGIGFGQDFPEGFGAVELRSGKIMVTGGERKRQILNQVFEVQEDTWTLTERKHMNSSRRNHGCLAIRNFAICLGGHNKSSADILRKCEQFVPKDNVWFDLPELNEERNFLSPCAVDDRFVYVLGRTGQEQSETCEVLDLDQPFEWKLLQVAFPAGKDCGRRLGFGVGSVQIARNEILLFGGLDESQYFNSSYVLNIETGIISDTGSPLKVKDAFYQRQPAVVCGAVYCFGYWSKCVHCFDIDTFEWTANVLS